MKETSILLLTVLLTGTLVNSTGFVFAQTNSTSPSNSTSSESEDSEQEEKVTICHIPPGNEDNPHTITIGESALEAHQAHGDTIGECVTSTSDAVGTNSTNSTSSTVDTSSIGNFGKYISELVHKRNADFNQQRVETIEAINNCREDIKNADSKEDKIDAQESCKATLKEIREKYKAEREEYRQLFKEYRDGMKILIKEAKGQSVSTEQKEKALKDIEEIKEMHAKIKEERKDMQEQIREERQATKEKKEN
jgi:chromosome segregation ATPase